MIKSKILQAQGHETAHPAATFPPDCSELIASKLIIPSNQTRKDNHTNNTNDEIQSRILLANIHLKLVDDNSTTPQ